MFNKDFAILLKESKGDKIELELDPEHPEKYAIPKKLWDMCMPAPDWFPYVKGKHHNSDK